MVIHTTFTAIGILLLCATSLFGQQESIRGHESENEIYQNRQRVAQLVPRETDIRSLDDAPMRCFLRNQVAKFTYETGEKDYFEFAGSLALKCLEEIQTNSNEFSNSQALHWKREILGLLRIHDQDKASIAFKKYFENEDLSLFDLKDIEAGRNVDAVTNRLLAQIGEGNISSDIFYIFLVLQERFPAHASQILLALLNSFEIGRDTTFLENNLALFAPYYISDKSPIVIKSRFLRFSFNLAQRQLMQSEPTGLFLTSYEVLKSTIPIFPTVEPSLLDTANGILLAMDSKISSANKALNEAYKRIENSKDKLSQAILEAEKAEKTSNADNLWLFAFNLAKGEKKFQTATDCILNFGLSDEANKMASFRDNLLADNLLPAILKENDSESIEYVIKRIIDNLKKSQALLKVSEWHLKLEDGVKSFESYNMAWNILQKENVSLQTVRIGMSSISIAVILEKTKGFEAASKSIRMANRLPTPSSDDMVGKPSRVKYVDEILLPVSYNVVRAFNILAKTDIDAAATATQEIESKNFKLAAEIVIEIHRSYPHPKELVHVK